MDLTHRSDRNTSPTQPDQPLFLILHFADRDHLMEVALLGEGAIRVIADIATDPLLVEVRMR